MFINRSINLSVILQFAWKMQLTSFLWSLTVYLFYDLGEVNVTMPFLPIATIGTAVAFYVGFKNNSAYDRLWEARKIWGNITNASRAFGVAVINYPGSRGDSTDLLDTKKRIIYRHIAWLNMLRAQLRKSPVFDSREYRRSAQIRIVEQIHGPFNFDSEREKILDDYLEANEKVAVNGRSNIAASILKNQHLDLVKLKNQGHIDEFEHLNMTQLIQEFYNYQGAAERIKSFPFPRQYANFSFIFVYIFVFLLPFAMVGEFSKVNAMLTWLSVPMTMLIAWVFNVMEQVGDASENPFDNGINDVPMTTICRNLEIELREMVGENKLPERMKPVAGIYM